MWKNAAMHTLPFAALLTLGAPATAEARPKPQITTAANAFGIDLLHKIIKAKPDGNCFISPYSIQQALLLADNGAGGVTKSQIGAVLHLGSAPLTEVNAQAKALRASLKFADPKVKIDVANALWADQSYKFSASYQKTCREFYGAQTRTVAFGQSSGAAAINAWASQNTRGKINHIVSPSDLAGEVSVLTNAVYFHGSWATPFNVYETQLRAFHLSSHKAEQVPMMTRLDMIDYVKVDGCEAVALPCGGGRLRMVVVLPAKTSSLNMWVNSLTPAKWSGLTGQLETTRVCLYLPRVHAHYDVSLKTALESLGMRTAFQSGADFTHMMPGLPLTLSDVLHETSLDIDEKGATAAAATAVSTGAYAAPLAPFVTLRIDRPFFCAIQDTRTGLMLFAGAIRKPQ